MTNSWNSNEMNVGRRVAAAAMCMALLCMGGVAWADSDSLATVGLSGRMTYQTPGELAQSGQDYGLHMGLRTEFLYVFGAEFEYAALQGNAGQDIYRPTMRLTGHLHLVNSRYFDLHLGLGLASAQFGDLVNVEGATTVYRTGVGMEVILGGHWAVGLDSYWSVAGLGHFNDRLRDSLQSEEGGFPDPREQVDPTQIEVGLALRYYL
jgi:hypothetical protein